VQFSTIGSVKARNENIAGYQFRDSTYPATGTIYYRIKSVDKDGKESYSVVRLINQTPTNISFKIFPNPAKGLINIYMESRVKENAQIVVRNIIGTTVYSQPWKINEGSNTIEINLPIIPGVYLLEIHEKGIIRRTKIVKQ
jgi:hypothetical protein